MFSDVDAVVVDNGSSAIRVGLGGDDAPRIVLPSTIGHLRAVFQETFLCAPGKSRVGVNKSSDQFLFRQTYPVKDGVVVDWDKMEMIWSKAFEQSQVHLERHPLLITDPLSNTEANREKMAQVMFESFKVPGLCLANPQLLSVYATGRVTGIVADIGFECTHVVPIFEGRPMENITRRLGFGGRHITDRLERLLQHGGYHFNAKNEYGVVQDIKEQFGYVALDFQHESVAPRKFETPDGQTVILRDECFSCTEPLFNPSEILGSECQGIHEATYQCITACDPDIRPIFFNNIIVAGGSSMFPGLKERLRKELAILSPNSTIRVVSRKDSVFIGASILPDLPTCQNIWIRKEDYFENGPKIVNKSIA